MVDPKGWHVTPITRRMGTVPRDDPDFADWLAARWPTLVRTLVFLGCARTDAAAIAREALVRCHPHWDRLHREDDIDVVVHREMLGRWHAHRRRSGPARAESAWSPALADTEGARLCGALLGQLDELPDDEREAAVLVLVADLSEVQAADVLDVPPGAVTARLRRTVAALDLDALRAAAGGEPGVESGVPVGR